MTQPTELETTRELTTLPLTAVAQPLVDFLKANGVDATVAPDQSGLGLQTPARVFVAASDFEQAERLLADFWAANEADGSEM
jgi:hypothetical protein